LVNKFPWTRPYLKNIFTLISKYLPKKQWYVKFFLWKNAIKFTHDKHH
jgi:hypothetical protein